MPTEIDVVGAFDLRGRSAVVTGAGSGIGRASALALAQAGAAVTCADIDGPSAGETASTITGAGGTAAGRRLDVADAAAVEDLVAGVVTDHGRIDIMCNIAGTMVDAEVLDITPADLDHIVGVNLKGVLHGCQSAGRRMVEAGSGSIVNMASAAVLTPTPGIGPYAMTKAAVVQLTRIMATEVGRRGVRVNAVAPGVVESKLLSRYWRRPDGSVDPDLRAGVLGAMAKAAPLRRTGEPADIAYAVLYLASDASSYVTGQLLSPNGGVAMQ